MFRVEVRRGEVDPATRCVVDGKLQHLLGVARAHPGVDNQHGLAATDDPDVGHQSDAPIGDHHQLAA